SLHDALPILTDQSGDGRLGPTETEGHREWSPESEIGPKRFSLASERTESSPEVISMGAKKCTGRPATPVCWFPMGMNISYSAVRSTWCTLMKRRLRPTCRESVGGSTSKNTA